MTVACELHLIIYVFSTMGFYLVNHAVNEYVLGALLFKKISVNLENDKTIEINAPNNNSQNRYIDDITYNGKKHGKNYFSYSELLKGATINFKMSDKPNYKRGTQKSDFPYSFSNEK